MSDRNGTSSPPPDDYLCGRISEALATDPSSHELGITVDVRAGVVYLRGEVATALRKEQAATIAAAAAGGLEIRNDISVVTVNPAGPEDVVS